MERRTFAREFKLEAVKLIKERGVSHAQASHDLGVHQTVLRNWAKAFGDVRRRILLASGAALQAAGGPEVDCPANVKCIASICSRAKALWGREMKLSFRLAFAVVAAAALVTPAPAFAAPSAAPINFCNNTSQQVGVFLGYYSSGVGDGANQDVLTGPFVSEGPWVVDPNQCQELHNPFDARYMFWFPVDPQSPHTPDDTTTTGTHMCVRGEHFTFEDENVSADACHRVSTATSHAVWVVPHKVDTVVNPTVNFTGWDTNYD